MADAKSGQVILQNPLPGTRGNMGLNTLEYAGTWRADMAIAKAFRIRESLRGTIRLDARNIFNHPQNSSEADGTQNALASEICSALAAIENRTFRGLMIIQMKIS